MKTLDELQQECAALGISVQAESRPKKATYVNALRRHHWQAVCPHEPLPEQIEPMLLSDWQDLTDEETALLEADDSGWVIQPKLDGVRALLHITETGIRVTGRCVSEVTFRLSEFQDNLPHLQSGWDGLLGTVLDGELVCPATEINTGKTITANPLQAAVAILATSPENARRIQDRHNAWLTFHAFDILRHRGVDVTNRPLQDRLQVLERLLFHAPKPHVKLVPTYSHIKPALHATVLHEGGEGTVWKQLDQPYEPGRRVKHWIKRKGAIQIEAFVTGFKPGTPGKGNAHLIGAVEFSAHDDQGRTRPVAWVSNWPDHTRQEMTYHDHGQPRLHPAFLGRTAVLMGQDWSAKSRRLRSARLVRWVLRTR